MVLVKGVLGLMAMVLAGMALMNYRVLLHHDGQVEFARKSEWTLADSFRFIGEENPAAPVPEPRASAPAPEQPRVVARAVPLPMETPVAPAPVASAPPVHVALGTHTERVPATRATTSPARTAASPAAMSLALRAKPAKLPGRPADEEDGGDSIRAMLSTVRPTPRRAEPDADEMDPPSAPAREPEAAAAKPAERNGAADCRRIRRSLAVAVTRMETSHPEKKITELHVFDLIQEGYLDSLQSCPALGGYILQRKAAAPEVRCTVHGTI